LVVATAHYIVLLEVLEDQEVEEILEEQERLMKAMLVDLHLHPDMLILNLVVVVLLKLANHQYFTEQVELVVLVNK
jgi:hypothetical protein